MKGMMAKIGMPAVFAVLLAACSQPQKDLLTAEFTGVDAQEQVYILAVPLADAGGMVRDTITMQDGHFNWDMPLTSLTEVMMELGRDRKVYSSRKPATSAAYRISFLMQPGEKVKIKARYEEGFLKYDLRGSADLKVQSDLRNSSRLELVEIGRLFDLIYQAMANGVENADEAYVDSLYEAYDDVRYRKANAELSYVEANPKSLLSAYMLLSHPNLDTFLNYLPVLDESIRTSELAEKLEAFRTHAEHMRLIRQNEEKLAPGATAPDFTLFDLNGKPVKLSDFSNKYVVLDFWGTWCPWCVKGIPQMKEYYAKHKNKVVFLSIACRDKAEKVKAMVEKESIKWVNVMNGEGDNDVSVLYGVSGYPTKILLQPGMKVQNRYLGEVPEFYQDLDNL